MEGNRSVTDPQSSRRDNIYAMKVAKNIFTVEYMLSVELAKFINKQVEVASRLSVGSFPEGLCSKRIVRKVLIFQQVRFVYAVAAILFFRLLVTDKGLIRRPKEVDKKLQTQDSCC